MTLEQSLNDVAEANDFTSVAVGRMLVGERVVWKATVHYDGHARDGIGCSGELSDHSIQDALHKAIIKAQANRTPPVIAPPVLPALEFVA